jgi:hypothetical protein
MPEVPAPKESHKTMAALAVVIILAVALFAGWWFYIR